MAGDKTYITNNENKLHRATRVKSVTPSSIVWSSNPNDYTVQVLVDGKWHRAVLTYDVSDAQFFEDVNIDKALVTGGDGKTHTALLVSPEANEVIMSPIPTDDHSLISGTTTGETVLNTYSEDWSNVVWQDNVNVYKVLVEGSDGKKHTALLTTNASGVISVIVHGTSPLSLPDAVADSLQYVKAFGGTEHAGVPAEYDVLSYIEGTNRTQYIDTGIIPNSSMNMYGKFGLVNITVNVSTFCGARDASSPTQGLLWFIRAVESSAGVDWFVSNDRYNVSTTINSGDIFEFQATNSLITIKKNGTTVGTNQFVPTGTTSYTLCLNTVNTAGQKTSESASITRVYRFTIAGVCDMIPARRKSDGVVGMYDIIRKQFFTNAGTGSFTAGAVIENLPSEYTQLEYLESTGTQYIDTGFKPNQDSGFVLDYYANGTEQPRVFMIAQNLNNLSYGYGIVLGRGANIAVYNGERRDTVYWKCNDFTGIGRYIVNVNKTAAFIKDSTGARVSYTFPSDTFQLEYNLCLFTLNNAGTITTTPATVRVYSFKLYDNGTLVRNFIPAKRNSNGEFGMYDLVNHQFYTNAGTGTFTAGVEINPLTPSPALPLDIVCNNGVVKPLRQIEYITTMGTQYIDTGVVGDLNTEYEITVKTNVVPSSSGVASYAVFGSRTSATENNIMSTYTLSSSGLGIINDFGDYNVTRQIPTRTSAEIMHRYKLTNSKSKRTITDLDTGWTDTVTTTYSGSLTTPTNLYIGYAGSLGGLANVGNLRGNIYGCKIWKSGALVRDFVPAIDPKGVVCLFDKVGGKYYYNAGTGTFIPSEDAHVQELEYLESTGTQYIDTGYAPTSNTNSMKAQMKHSYLSYKTAQNKNPFMFGSSTLVGNLRCYNRFGLLNNNFVYTVTRDSSREIDTNISPVLGTVYDTEYSVNFGASASLKILNGSTVVVNDTQTGNMQRSTETYYLFAINHNVTVDGIRETIGRIYSCKIYDNGTLVRDFMPARRLADNVLGMWDKVNKVFYTNAGTGTFVAGPAVYSEPDYTVVGTTETIADSLSNSATAEDLFNLTGAIDEQEILSGNVIHKVGVKILTGSENWTTESTWFKADILEPSALNSLFCSHFERRVITQDNSVFKNIDSSVLMVHYSACSTVDSFKEWLRNQYEAGQPVIVLYPLVTPTAESVAGQTLQVADGDNTLTITQASLPDLELEAKYEIQGA